LFQQARQAGVGRGGGLRWCSAAALLLLAGCGGPPQPSREEQVQRADEAMRQGQYEAAAAAYGEAAVNGPLDGTLLAKQAEALVNAWRFQDALDPARRAAALLPENRELKLLVARAALRQSSFDEVLDDMTALLANDPDNLQALVALGNAYARLPDPTRAVNLMADARSEADYLALGTRIRRGNTRERDAHAEEAFRRALRVSPNSYSAQIAWANFLLACDRGDEAEQVLESVTKRYPDRQLSRHAIGVYQMLHGRLQEAERHLKAAADLGDDYDRRATAASQLASLYAETNRDDEAEALLDSLRPEDKARGRISLQLARLEVRSGKLDAALSRLDTLIARKPPVPEAGIIKAEILLRQGLVERALASARAAVAAIPASADARTVLGQTLSARGDLENALDEYLEAVRLDPGSGSRMMDLLRMEFALKRTKEVVAHAREAVRLNPGNPQATIAPLRALVLAQDYRGAEQELVVLSRLNETGADVLTEMAKIAAAQGRRDDAKTGFSRALSLAPDFAEALQGMAMIEVAEQRGAEARRRVDGAVSRHPSDGTYLRLAADVYAATKDAPGAEALRRRAIVLDPADATAVMALVTDEFVSRYPHGARQMLERLLERRPRVVTARVMLASIYEQTDRKAEAVDLYRAVVAEPVRPDTELPIARASVRLAALRIATP
jgi:tetratricopeptide (TPR) repeat protein